MLGRVSSKLLSKMQQHKYNIHIKNKKVIGKKKLLFSSKTRMPTWEWRNCSSPLRRSNILSSSTLTLVWNIFRRQPLLSRAGNGEWISESGVYSCAPWLYLSVSVIKHLQSYRLGEERPSAVIIILLICGACLSTFFCWNLRYYSLSPQDVFGKFQSGGYKFQ